MNNKPTNRQLGRGIELLAEHLASTVIEAPDLAPLFADLGFTPETPNVVNFPRGNISQGEPDTLSTAIAAYFTEHPDRPPLDIRADNGGDVPTPWVREQTERALLLIAQSMHEFLTTDRSPKH